MRHRIHFAAAFLASAAFFLNGCSSGSGGSTLTATVSQPAQSQSGGVGLTSFQTPSSTTTYQAASATFTVAPGSAASALAAAGQGATLTLTTDSIGNINKITVNIPTTGATFTQTYIGIANPNTLLSNGQLVSYLRETYGFANTTSFIISQVAGAQFLSSSSYGLWASGDSATTGRGGTFAIGNLTPAASVPTTGSASFTGSTTGQGVTSNGSTIFALQGNAQINANFATHVVTTTLTNLATENISTTAVGTLPDLTASATLSGNTYAGTLTGTGLSGAINGNFYGSAASETTGTWQATGNGTNWIGAYGAR